MIGGKYLHRITTVTWTDTGENTNVTPDTDRIIDVMQAASIVIQVDSANANNTSTDFDINVHSSPDGDHWDSVPYTTKASVTSGVVVTFTVASGIGKIRLRLDNNAAGTTAYVTARVLIRVG